MANTPPVVSGGLPVLGTFFMETDKALNMDKPYRPEKMVVRYRRRPAPLGGQPIEIAEKQGNQNLKIANGDTHATT